MHDYISREAAIKLICGDRCGCHHYECGRDTKNCRPVELLKSIPAADVVEVVRCRDCIHRPTDPEKVGHGFSVEFPDERCPCHCEDGWYSWMPPDTWFCAYGERKKVTLHD